MPSYQPPIPIGPPSAPPQRWNPAGLVVLTVGAVAGAALLLAAHWLDGMYALSGGPQGSEVALAEIIGHATLWGSLLLGTILMIRPARGPRPR